ncbi:MAG: butyrate kinase, partial [Deltaproteobacteria bacterium]|nr:butyrate kinase [Deltaproteobacteria bacterium]
MTPTIHALKILTLNPGGGSTRVATFDGAEEIFSVEVKHDQASLDAHQSLDAQLTLRLTTIRGALDAHDANVADFDAIVGRGGPYRPLPGGTYRINSELLDDIRAGRIMADHPSKFGAPLAWALAQEHGLPAFIVDPVSVDELDPRSRLTGLPELPRRSLFHALNIKAVARRHARERGVPLVDLRLIVAHLGSGISVALLRDGRAIDVNNSADEGPFSTRRAGTLPASALLKLTEQADFNAGAMKRQMMAQGGLLAHLGTADLGEAEARAASGDVE